MGFKALERGKKCFFGADLDLVVDDRVEPIKMAAGPLAQHFFAPSTISTLTTKVNYCRLHSVHSI